MAKVIKYKFLSGGDNPGTEQIFINKSVSWSEENEEIAKQEAFGGEYTVEYDVQDELVHSAPRNITSGEYFTVSGVLYKAIENIPNGCAVINGQNAIATTIEEQLYELTRGD